MKVSIIAASVLLSVAGTGVQGLPPEEIAAAIAQGLDGKLLQKTCRAYGENGFAIVVEGPIGRIMRAARAARGQHREFTVADVTPALSRAVLTVAARRDPTLRRSVAEYVTPGSGLRDVYRTDMVLRSKSAGAAGPMLLRPIGRIVYDPDDAPGYRSVVQPPVGYQANGPDYMPFPGSDMKASFDLAAFRAMPQGDVEVAAFMTDAGERTCKISEKDRRTLR